MKNDNLLIDRLNQILESLANLVNYSTNRQFKELYVEAGFLHSLTMEFVIMLNSLSTKEVNYYRRFIVDLRSIYYSLFQVGLINGATLAENKTNNTIILFSITNLFIKEDPLSSIVISDELSGFKTLNLDNIMSIIRFLKSKYNVIIPFKSDSEGHSFTFKGKISKEQIKNLHAQLIANRFIAKDSSNELFELIFTNQPLSSLEGRRIMWIDTPPTGHKANLQTLYELLYLLKEKELLDKSNFDTKPGPDNIFSKIDICFKDFKHLSVKIPHGVTGNTKRKHLLREVVTSL